ncbi:hypothetical protein [Eubacterium sp.]|uniref:hypothetical protein n=1 Tax=Eubacterium sp. TaxID=142586 RepID=UPI00261BD79F|nr:hypothetical protein [Eubacterium sp.]MDD7332368.1 hypothetical protein [Eubacterium sp.]
MHDFRYVTKNEAKPIKKELYQILYEVQDLIRDKFTFSFTPIGSSSHNMITYDAKSNIGFDFDINIEVNDDNEDFEPKEIRTIIRTAIDRIAPRYGYKSCEDSTRVLTIKKVNTFTSRIIHSCDFAIVYNCTDGRQQYIRFNKDNNYYSWEYQAKGFADLNKKTDWLKKNGLWGNLQDYYIEKKNANENPDKHSRSVFAESINEMCQKNGYRK